MDNKNVVNNREFIKKDLGLGRDFFLRDNSIDIDIYNAVIIHDEYGYIDFFESPKVIIDAGANIGTASVYYSLKYPDAKIYAIEPEKDNFELLKMNTEMFPNVLAINCALTSDDGWGRITDPYGTPLGYQIENTTDDAGDILCYSLDTIMEKYNINEVDILKMDVEGAEKEIVENCGKWIGKIKTVVIEMHERYQAGTNKAVFTKFDSIYGLQWIGGENYYFTNSGVGYPIIPNEYKKESPAELPIESYRKYRDLYEQGYAKIVQNKDDELIKRDEIIMILSSEIEKKDSVIYCVERDRDEQIKYLSLENKKRDDVITEMVNERDEKDKLIKELIAVRDEKDKLIKELIAVRDEKDKIIEDLTERVN